MLLGASVMLSSGCLKDDLDFSEPDGTVVTHLYTGAVTPFSEVLYAGSRLIDFPNTMSPFKLVYTPEELPEFVAPPEDWVKEEGLKVTWEESHGRKVCIIAPRSGVDKYIFYLHGGGYVLNIDASQYDFFKKIIKELGYGIIIPDYPLAAAYTYKDAYAMVEDVWKDWAERVGSDKMTLFGDSAGGGFCLAFAEYLKANSLPGPGGIILFSPWLDVTTTNAGMYLLDDVMLDRSGAQACGVAWAGDSNPRHYQISPINGDLGGLPRVHIFIGGRDMLYADVDRLRTRMRKEGLPLTVYEYPNMFHIWAALFPNLRESRHAVDQMIEILK